LEALAKQDPALTYALSGKIGRNDPVPGIGMAPPFNNAAFELAKGGVSEPVEVPRGWAVLYVKDVHEPRLPELAEVEPRVRQAVSQQKQQQLAMDRLRQAKAGGQTLEQVAQQLGVQVQESQEFGRQGFIPGLGMSPELAQAALALQPGQVGGPVAAGPGAVLFEVVERKSWDPKQFAANREATRKRLEQEQVDRLIASLLEQRRRELDVQYDRELLESLGVAEVAES
jgi:peptidyl-prolyl cis-trans isomerase D